MSTTNSFADLSRNLPMRLRLVLFRCPRCRFRKPSHRQFQLYMIKDIWHPSPCAKALWIVSVSTFTGSRWQFQCDGSLVPAHPTKFGQHRAVKAVLFFSERLSMMGRMTMYASNPVRAAHKRENNRYQSINQTIASAFWSNPLFHWWPILHWAKQ